MVKKSQAGGGVAVKIEHAVYESAKMFGRHFDDKDELYSQITRQSIDVMKESFRKDVSMEEWALIKKLKEVRRYSSNTTGECVLIFSLPQKLDIQ